MLIHVGHEKLLVVHQSYQTDWFVWCLQTLSVIIDIEFCGRITQIRCYLTRFYSQPIVVIMLLKVELTKYLSCRLAAATSVALIKDGTCYHVSHFICTKVTLDGNPFTKVIQSSRYLDVHTCLKPFSLCYNRSKCLTKIFFLPFFRRQICANFCSVHL